MPPSKRNKMVASLLAAYTTPTPATPPALPNGESTPQATPPAPPNGESTPQATPQSTPPPAPPIGESTPPSIQGAPSPTPALTPVPTSSTPIEGQSSTSAVSTQPLAITSGSASCSATATESGEPLPTIIIICQNVDVCAGAAPTTQHNIGSHKTLALVSTLGRKLPLVWSHFLRGPDSTQTYTLLVRDIGAGVRGHVPMQAASYSALDQ